MPWFEFVAGSLPKCVCSRFFHVKRAYVLVRVHFVLTLATLNETVSFSAEPPPPLRPSKSSHHVLINGTGLSCPSKGL